MRERLTMTQSYSWSFSWHSLSNAPRLMTRTSDFYEVNGDTTLAFCLELVHNLCVLEGTLTHFLGLIFEILDGSLFGNLALVYQMNGGGGFAGV